MSPQPAPPPSFDPEDRALAQALRQRAQAWLDARQDHRFADAGMLGKLAWLTLLCGLCYAAVLASRSGGAFFAAYLGFVFSAMLLTVNVVHDASHNAFFRPLRANRWLNRIVTLPLGLDPDCWRVRHVLLHHSHTNIEGHDPDIDANGVLRQAPWHRWRPFMRYQRLYWPVVAACTFPWYIWWMDWLDRAGRTRITPRLLHQGWRGWAWFLLGKGGHMLLALWLPWQLGRGHFSLGTIALTYLLCQMLSSLFFVMLLVGTHWATAQFYAMPASGRMPHGRCTHMLRTTLDWHTRPRWLGYWLGGGNLHLSHHLFPHWSHRHYPSLSPLIAEVAAQHGQPRPVLRLGQVLPLQQRFLRAMGQPPAPPPAL